MRLLGTLAVMAVLGCAPHTMGATSSSVGPGTAPREVVVERFDGSEVTLQVGDVLVARRPGPFEEWRVAYAAEPLKLIAPADPAHPGPEGWRFTAQAAGQTDLTVTPVTRGGAAPPQFTITVSVRPARP